jgi:hypothetical protein
MDGYPPRHLARHPAGSSLLRPVAAALVVALVSLALVATLIATDFGASVGLRPGARSRSPDVTVRSVPTTPASPPVTGPFELPTSTVTATTAPDSVSLLPDPSFERGLAGWRAGARTLLDRVGSARDGRWAANFRAISASDPSIVAPKLAVVRGTVMYSATLWLRSSRPGTSVTVVLAELRHGRSFAVDTVGTVLNGVAWQRLEIAHEGHQAGNTLALEVGAPGLTRQASVSLDLVDVRVDPHMGAGGDG